MAARICVVCKTLKDTADMIRVARIDGKYLIDTRGNANGRGCHVCPACVQKAIKTRALNRSFKTKLPDEIYEVLAKHTSEVYTNNQEN